MTESKDQWLKAIKEKLDDYSEPLPKLDWARIERSIPPGNHTPIYKLSIYKRWQAFAAAIAFIIAASSLLLWLSDIPAETEVNHYETFVQEVIPPRESAQKQIVQEEHSAPNIRKASEPRKVIAATRQTRHTAETVSSHTVNPPFPEKADSTSLSSESSLNNEQQADKVNTYPRTESPAANRHQRRHSGMQLGTPSAADTKKKWAIALAVNDARGIFPLTETKEYKGPYATPNPRGNKISLINTDGTLSSSWDEPFLFANNLSHRFSQRVVADIQHQKPISFGLSVRKAISGKFALESGLSYTLLSSDIHYENYPNEKQKLHYIGIPLRLSRALLSKSDFTLYASGGGSIEKCIYAKRGEERLTESPLQLSVAALIGVEYKISRYMGIYLEPGINYFFDNGSSIKTIRKEHPCDFTLQAGIRLNY